MKKQYFRMFLSGCIYVVFLTGIAFSGHFQPVFAAEELANMASSDGTADANSDNTVLPEKSMQSGKLVLNFDNADLTEVIRTLAELLDINYLLDKGVSGKVTIHTAGKLHREDLFPVFYQILEINGVTAVKDKN
ncbi:MAG: hypothetical protein KAH06_05625, partial [Desulfobacterales bacterium]|nr:hypothetical protein [Desulfobacterales bacterium]